MKPSKLVVCLFVLTLIASACGGGDGGDTAAPDSGQSSGDNNGDGGSGDGDGSDGGDGGGGDGLTTADARADAAGAGEDFPIAIPGGWEVDQLAVLEEQGAEFSGGVQLLYANEDFDDLVAFYDEWTEAHTDEFARSETPETVVYTRGSPLALITISENFEVQDKAWAALTVSAASE